METILIVEDSPEYQRVIATMVRRLGFEPVIRSSGKGVVAHVADNPVRAVILDIYLPEVDGIELVRDLRAAAPKLPLIGISGDPLQIRVVRLLGADAVLEKPFEQDDLARCLSALGLLPAG